MLISLCASVAITTGVLIEAARIIVSKTPKKNFVNLLPQLHRFDELHHTRTSGIPTTVYFT
jgi:hypothetical protein